MRYTDGGIQLGSIVRIDMVASNKPEDRVGIVVDIRKSDGAYVVLPEAEFPYYLRSKGILKGEKWTKCAVCGEDMLTVLDEATWPLE